MVTNQPRTVLLSKPLEYSKMTVESEVGGEGLESLVRRLVDRYLDQTAGFQFELPREQILELLVEACDDARGASLTTRLEARLEPIERRLERLGITVAQIQRALECGGRPHAARAAHSHAPDSSGPVDGQAQTKAGMLEMLVKQNLELRRSKESAAMSACEPFVMGGKR